MIPYYAEGPDAACSMLNDSCTSDNLIVNPRYVFSRPSYSRIAGPPKALANQRIVTVSPVDALGRLWMVLDWIW
jgi:hypothetical protein